MRKNSRKKDFNLWRKLINVWSFIFFAMIIVDFIYRNACEDILNAISVIYISILAIYVSNKEFERWYDRHEQSHPGEIFVMIWTILIAVLFLLDLLYGTIYKLPAAVVSAYIAVLTILVITRKSKELYRTRHRRRR